MIKKTRQEVLDLIKKQDVTLECEIDEYFVLDFDFERYHSITNLHFKNAVSSKGLKSEFSYSFINCHFYWYFNFSELKVDELYFKDCIFFEKPIFRNVEMSKLIFSNCTFKKGLFSEKLQSQNLEFYSATSESNIISFHASKVSQCFISDLAVSSKLLLTSLSKDDNSKPDGNVIQSLFIELNNESDSFILLDQLEIQKTLLISGFNKNGKCFVRNCNINSIILNDLFNTGLVSAIGLQTKDVWVNNSNLGTIELSDIDFSNSKVKINNSNIQGIIPTNINWCSKIVLKEKNNSDSKKLLELKETYRQLKSVSIKNNDKVEELKFHSLEMQAYANYLRVEKKMWADRFIFFVGRISSNHGLSWTRAISLLLLISFIVFNINKLLLGYNFFSATLVPLDLANWIESINPIRKFESVYTIYRKSGFTNLAILIDVSSRLIYSFLLFQFVNAFRKYVKK